MEISRALYIALLFSFVLSGTSHAVPMIEKETHSKPREPMIDSASWYVDFSGGSSNAHDTSVSNSANTNEFEYDKGYNFSAALGYRPPHQHSFWGYTRTEVALGYQSSDLDNDGVNPVSGTSGRLSGYSAMLNFYYDYKNSSPITPYLGAGIGLSQFRLKDASRINISGDDTTDIMTSYQFMTGLSLEPAATPSTAFHMGYRYFSTFSDLEFSDATGAALSLEHKSHNIEGGIRWSF